MLTRIVQPSPELEAFLDQLHLDLSQPQHEHLLHLVDSLLVCDERKTLTALRRQFLEATDASNWADFLRISPWSALETRDALRRHQVTWLLELAQARGLPKVLTCQPRRLAGQERQADRTPPKVLFDVRVMFSTRHPRARSWAYFASTDLARSVVATLRGYGSRWSCEVVNFYAKTPLGLADFRVRSYEAVERYVLAVHLAWRRWSGMFSPCIWPGRTWSSGWPASVRPRSDAMAM